MKITRCISPFLYAFLLIASRTTAAYDHVITFFIRQYPEIEAPKVQKIARSVKKNKIPSMLLKQFCPKADRGIVGTYAGFTSTSDHNGQLKFPRITQNDSFKLIITPSIVPVFMIANTIHHWELSKNEPAAVYLVARAQDEQTKLYYWNVTKGDPLKNNILPLDSITLFAKPKNIIVPEGITLTTGSPQLVLPPVYATANIKTLSNALHYLAIRQFFRQPTTNTKKQNDLYYSQHIDVR